MEKSDDAFRTISEVAELLDVPQHVLRFWETRFMQIRPMKRSGGRRYYRSDDVDLIRGIHHLLYAQGYTIKGVQRILKEQGVGAVQSSWRSADALPSHLNKTTAIEDSANTSQGNIEIIMSPSIKNDRILKPADATLKANYRRDLQLALYELMECRRMLCSALEANSAGA